MNPLSDCRLYAFVDTAYLEGRAPELVAQRLCDGGADLIQLRAKGATLDDILRLAERVLPITQHAGVGLVINDHPQIALEIGAPYCHLGQEDFFDAGYKHVSQLLAPVVRGQSSVAVSSTDHGHLTTDQRNIQIGLSTHSPAQAQRALQAGAAYLAVGPVFATPTKPSAQPVTLEYVRWSAENIGIPWFAIGGITLANLDSVLQAGARRIGVVSAILKSSDIAAECRKFKHLL